MDDIFVYIVDMPTTVAETVVPCFGGYTIYLNAQLSYLERTRAYCHALKHIGRNDWNKTDVQMIESEAHSD